MKSRRKYKKREAEFVTAVQVNLDRRHSRTGNGDTCNAASGETGSLTMTAKSTQLTEKRSPELIGV